MHVTVCQQSPVVVVHLLVHLALVGFGHYSFVIFTEINAAVNITGQCVLVVCRVDLDPAAASAALRLPEVTSASCFFELEILITKIVANPPPNIVENIATSVMGGE